MWLVYDKVIDRRGIQSLNRIWKKKKTVCYLKEFWQKAQICTQKVWEHLFSLNKLHLSVWPMQAQALSHDYWCFSRDGLPTAFHLKPPELGSFISGERWDFEERVTNNWREQNNRRCWITFLFISVLLCVVAHAAKEDLRVSTSAPVGDPDLYLWVYILSKLKPRSVWVIRYRWPGSTGQVPVKIQVLVI